MSMRPAQASLIATASDGDSARWGGLGGACVELDAAVLDSLLHQRGVDDLAVARRQAVEATVHDQVDLARHTGGFLQQQLARVGLQQQAAVAARGLETEADVVRDLHAVQPVQPGVLDHPAAQLAQAVLRQGGLQLGLAGQQDLQQLLLVGFEVAQQADQLQRAFR